ncbi:MAG: ribosome biogenesis GTP-binding protein YihA/YsxC [Bacteroidota bacterium]
MLVQSAEFVKSSKLLRELPPMDYPEYAFVGRSNVGKSSLINRLCQRKNLAKTSGTPGKTQLINHFLINNTWYLVDLPGYGYAKVSKKIRENFTDMIFDYLVGRENLMNTYVLIDSRHKPQAIDLEFIEFLGVKEIPFTLVFTKIDKLTSHKLAANREVYEKELGDVWEELPQMLFTSAQTGEGREELLEQITSYNPLFYGT